MNEEPNDDLPIKVQRMCDIILGNIFGNKELDSLALEIGHDSRILNAKESTTLESTKDDGYVLCPLCQGRCYTSRYYCSDCDNEF